MSLMLGESLFSPVNVEDAQGKYVPHALKAGVNVLTGKLSDRVFLLDLAFKQLGTSKPASVALIETDADKELLSVRKKTLKCEEVREISALISRARSYVDKLSIPTSDQFRRGMYLMPFSMSKQIEGYLRGAQNELDNLVDNLIAVYDQRIDEDRDKLNSQFNEADYMAKEDVKEAYGMRFEYVLLGKEGLKLIDESVYDRENAKLQARMLEAAEESRVILAESLKDMVKRIHDQLTPGEDGKPKVFKDSLLKNVIEFADTFSAKNILGDKDLEALCAGLKAQLTGVSGDAIRKDGDVADKVKAYCDSAVKALETAVTTKPSRIIWFEEDEETK